MATKYAPLIQWCQEKRPEHSLLSFARIESILGFSLPGSYRVHAASWSAGGSLGGQLRRAGWASYLRSREGGVLFERTGHRVSTTDLPPMSSKNVISAGDIILLGCVSKKLDRPAPAQDLYISPLWRFRRAYAEATGKPWMILSAAHGLVRPNERLDPYDVALQDLQAAEKFEWANRTFIQLRKRFGDLSGLTIEIHAGAPYVETGLGALMQSSGATVLRPLSHLKFGQQLSWYRQLMDSVATASRR